MKLGRKLRHFISVISFNLGWSLYHLSEVSGSIEPLQLYNNKGKTTLDIFALVEMLKRRTPQAGTGKYTKTPQGDLKPLYT